MTGMNHADAQNWVTKEKLTALALSRALGAYEAGEYALFLEWLSSVPQPVRPLEKIAEANYALARVASADGRWGDVESHLKAAIGAARVPLHEQRMQALRKRATMMDDETWTFLQTKVDQATRLAPDALRPQIDAVWACGAYHSLRSQQRNLPWSIFLRIAKEAPPDTDDGSAVLSLAGSFMARFVREKTSLLNFVDAILPIPANPLRYSERMMSLPDELARATATQLGVPFLFGALVSTAADDLELRGLSWSERRAAVRGSLAAGKLGIAHGRNVLVVDDVTTSGATLREAGRALRGAGAAAVYGIAMAHTEG